MKLPAWIYWTVGLLAFAFWVAIGFGPGAYYKHHHSADNSPKPDQYKYLETAGQFGDSWGPATSFFTGLAFAISSFTLLKQIEEHRENIKLQHKQAELAEKMRVSQEEQSQRERMLLATKAIAQFRKNVYRFNDVVFPVNRVRNRAKELLGARDRKLELMFSMTKANLDTNVLMLQHFYGKEAKELTETVVAMLSYSREHIGRNHDQFSVDIGQHIRSVVECSNKLLNSNAAPF